ncbi:MAG: hypothetical protein HY569_01720 [Candidatus Magasanikbacteria bacterium]|nr:hypothetical protein [Candidatus Magasanikbacteria bacterium]
MFRKILYTRLSLGIFLVTVILGLIFLLNPSWGIKGDGHGYYIYLRSLYFDHDLNFSNEYARYDALYGTHFLQSAITPIGKLGNPFAIGLSIFWLPFFIAARIFSAFNSPDYFLAGFADSYQVWLGFGSIIYGIIGAIFLFCALKKLFSARSAWSCVCAVIFLSPLVHYLVYEPLMSHALSFAVNSVLFWYSIIIYQAKEIRLKNLLMLGFLGGLVILVRWQEVFTWLVPLVILVKKLKENKIKLRQIIIPPAVAFFCFIPQMIVWKYLYGSFLVIPQGQGFIQLGQLKIFAILFSGMHGLFSWHPLLLIGLVGLFVSYRRDRLLFYSLLAVFLGQIFINGSVIDWWGGSAFGARKFIGALFVFAYGFSYLLDFLSQKKFLYRLLVFVLLFGVFWNYFLLISAPKGYLSLSESVSYKQLYSAPLKAAVDYFR